MDPNQHNENAFENELDNFDDREWLVFKYNDTINIVDEKLKVFKSIKCDHNSESKEKCDLNRYEEELDCRTMKKNLLDFSYFDIKKEDIVEGLINETLLDDHTELIELNLSSLNIGEKMVSLADKFYMFEKLEVLNLSSNKLGEDVCTVLFNPIRNLPLKCLNLKNNNFNDLVITDLTGFVNDVNTLEILILDNNKITIDGAHDFLRELDVQNLKYINLLKNRIDKMNENYNEFIHSVDSKRKENCIIDY